MPRHWTTSAARSASCSGLMTSIWTARALSGRGLVYLALGSPARADSDFVVAGRLLPESGQEAEVAHTVLNRGWAAFRSGDLPAALAFHR